MVEVVRQDPFNGVGIVRRYCRDDPPTDIDFERYRLVRSSRVEVPPSLEIGGTPDAPSPLYSRQWMPLHRSHRAIRDRFRTPRV